MRTTVSRSIASADFLLLTVSVKRTVISGFSAVTGGKDEKKS